MLVLGVEVLVQLRVMDAEALALANVLLALELVLDVRDVVELALVVAQILVLGVGALVLIPVQVVPALAVGVLLALVLAVDALLVVELAMAVKVVTTSALLGAKQIVQVVVPAPVSAQAVVTSANHPAVQAVNPCVVLVVRTLVMVRQQIQSIYDVLHQFVKVRKNYFYI